jgi:hypothetical protein
MDINDFIDVLRIDIGVPGAFRIDHQHRAFFTPVEAAGLVDSDFALTTQTQLLDAAFGVFLGWLRAAVGATGTRVVALVQAKKYVMLIIRLVSHLEPI